MKRLNSMVTIIVLMAGSFLFVSGEDTPQKTLFKNFEKAMKGVRFSGFFTVDGAKETAICPHLRHSISVWLPRSRSWTLMYPQYFKLLHLKWNWRCLLWSKRKTPFILLISISVMAAMTSLRDDCPCTLLMTAISSTTATSYGWTVTRRSRTHLQDTTTNSDLPLL